MDESFEIADILLKDQFKEEEKEKAIANSTGEEDASVKPLDLSQIAGNYEIQAGVQVEISIKTE